MTHYATIGIDHIQTHLARTRHLWGRRGASALLVDLTSDPERTPDPGQGRTVQSILAQHPAVQLERGAISVDGLVTLTSANKDALQAAAFDLADALRSTLPGLTARVNLFDADSLADLIKFEPDNHPGVRFLPVLHEFPPARLCEECGVAEASKVVKVYQENKNLCSDCNRRWLASARVGEDHRTPVDSPFAAEPELHRHLQEIGEPERDLVHTFEELAALVASEDKQQRTWENNHLALIFADGNGVGALFKGRRSAAVDDQDVKNIATLSKGLEDATKKSLWAASEAIILDTDVVVPVIPHLLGGDDLLVSVPADRAWPFIRTLLATAEQTFTRVDAGLSLSLGVVICQSAFPFGDQVELAEAALKVAKAHVGGHGFSLQWVDVTESGPFLPDRAPWTLTELANRAPALDHMLASGNTAFSSLRAALADAEFAPLLTWNLARRHKSIGELLRLLKIDQSSPPTTQSGLDLLAAMLSMARWWRNPSKEAVS